MAEITNKNGLDIYTIISEDGKTRASFVPEKGGAGCSIMMPHQGESREILFVHDHFWDKNNLHLPGGWPFLFPICGRLERMGKFGDYLYNGRVYNMPIHGFAAMMPWEVISHDEHNLVIELTETKNTLAMYPFKFRVQLSYTVTDGKLTCEQTYINMDAKVMYYYAGFHPYFLTPEADKGKADVLLNYQPKRGLRYNDGFTDVIGERPMFELPVSVASHEIIEFLTEVPKDNLVYLHFPDKFRLYMQAKGEQNNNMFPYVHLYSVPSEPFVCVEPIMGFPNALNTAYGSRKLEPGQSEKAVVELYCE